MTFSGLFILSDCNKPNAPLTNGYYSGSLSYQGQLLFDAISFNEDNYEEVTSGGARNQKFPCLTKGTYRIKNNKITFTPNNSPICSNSNFLLKGEYSLIQEGYKITFQKGTGQDLQIYTLTQIIDKHLQNGTKYFWFDPGQLFHNETNPTRDQIVTHA
jgi:hypothetical protein